MKVIARPKIGKKSYAKNRRPMLKDTNTVDVIERFSKSIDIKITIHNEVGTIDACKKGVPIQ
jgi:hypothetical protein